MYSEERPWGKFTNLYDKSYTKVKTILVSPGHRLSLQSHTKRSENWIVVRGVATVQLNEDFFTLEPGQSIFIPVGSKHRLENQEDTELEIIEIQTGSYFGEDDITRYSDDYNRS